MIFKKRADPVLLDLPPQPKVLTPTGLYEGNDGKWSTFPINIAGDGEGKGQNFRVLISTSWSVPLIPAQVSWCDENCSKNRGISSYNGDQPKGLLTPTSSWQTAGIYALPPLPGWSKDLYASNNGTTGETWGMTTVGLGEASRQSITLPEQYAVNFVSQNLFMGYLGLAVGAISPAGATKSTFLSTLAAPSSQLIASSAYGYTAGAYYRNNNKGILGNMVFGGYDRSRLEGTGVSISMPSKQNNTLIVGVQSILYAPKQDVLQQTQSFTADRKGFSAIIDSTFPYLVLPDAIVDQFAAKFGLIYDNKMGLYTVNSSAHDHNTQQEATVSFKVGAGPEDSAKFAEIVLPYAAFDLQISLPPTLGNATNYFPIKKSTNGLYVLGRTFLQEAYIVVDYGRANFTVAPAHFSDPMPKEDLVSIWNTTYVRPTAPAESEDTGLSAGAIAGIVVGIVALFLLIGAGAFFWWRRRRNAKTKALRAEEKPIGVETVDAGSEIKHRRISELTGSSPAPSPMTKPAGTYYGSDHKQIGPISEMSPESTPAELYSPPVGSTEGADYFSTAAKPRRRGATRDSAGNSPGTPIAELPGEDSQQFVVKQDPQQLGPIPHQQNRGPSDTSLSTNIDEVIAAPPTETSQVQRSHSSRFVEHTNDNAGVSRAEQVVSPMEELQSEPDEAGHPATTERRPSHVRGLSDITVNSESTAVSQPTADELERWARSVDNRPENKPT